MALNRSACSFSIASRLSRGPNLCKRRLNSFTRFCSSSNPGYIGVGEGMPSKGTHAFLNASSLLFRFGLTPKNPINLLVFAERYTTESHVASNFEKRTAPIPRVGSSAWFGREEGVARQP